MLMCLCFCSCPFRRWQMYGHRLPFPITKGNFILCRTIRQGIVVPLQRALLTLLKSNRWKITRQKGKKKILSSRLSISRATTKRRKPSCLSIGRTFSATRKTITAMLPPQGSPRVAHFKLVVTLSLVLSI